MNERSVESYLKLKGEIVQQHATHRQKNIVRTSGKRRL